MSCLTLARATAVAALASFLGIAIACTSDPNSGPATFCAAAKSSWRSCPERSSCDDTLAQRCATVDKALSPSTVKATQDCLESGICGSAGCVTRAQKSSVPTQAHLELAASYCSSCAPDVTDCERQFYAKKGKLPGVLVLPYGEDVATAVRDECTTATDVCRSKFATCAAETIARVTSEAVSFDLADCVAAAFRVDDEEGSTAGPGTGPQITICTPANCNGCCRDDKCEEGTSESACGSAAGACETCSGAQFCAAGKCKEPCGPNNCTGCCEGDTCLPGTETTKCGEDGAACGSCTTQGPSFICSNQKCIDGSCRATCPRGCCTQAGCQPGNVANACGGTGQACVDCGYGRTCGATQACELDQNSVWNFYVSSAVVPNKNKSGKSWDTTDGVADPYLVAYSSLGSSSHTGQTGVKNDSHSPYWGEAPLKGVKASELLKNLSFEIWDEDVAYNDLIGGCAIPVPLEAFNGYLRSHVCPATASTVEVKLYYRIRKP